MSPKRRRFAARRRACGYSQEAFAEAVGVERTTVTRWESADTEPQPWFRRKIARVLQVTLDELDELLADTSGVDEGATGSSVTCVVDTPAIALLAAVADRSGDAHRASTDTAVRFDHGSATHADVGEMLAGMYRTVDPRLVWPMAAAFADDLLSLYQVYDGEQTTESAAVVVHTHCQVGLWACHTDQPARAYRYLATAAEIAASVKDEPLHARALGALSYLYSSAPRGGSGGNPRRALELLDHALTLASKADAFTRGWLGTWRADQYATLGNLAAAQADIDMAAAALDTDDSGPEGGFFSRRHYGYGMRGHLDSVRGLAGALAGYLDESERTFDLVQKQAANSRRRVATFGHQALAYLRASQPEAACHALTSSVDLALAKPYAMGLKRVAGVRAGFRPSWARLACVRELDRRLRQPSSGRH